MPYVAPFAAAALKYGPRAYNLYQNYKYGRRTIRKLRRNILRTKNIVLGRKPTKRQWSGVSTGFYLGKFRKPQRKLRGVTKKLAKYQSRGFVSTKEIHGKVDDADCVYVGHSTFDPVQIADCVAIALVRKLFKKAGFDMDSPDQELPLFDAGNADGFKIDVVQINSAGVPATFSYTTVDNDTCRKVALSTGLNLGNRFQGVMQNTDTVDYERITLYSSDRNGVSTNWRLAAEIDLRREVLEISVASELHVQNRTKTDSGSTSTDAVDNQPLKGYLYQFAGGVPKSKTYGDSGLNNSLQNGVLLVQAVDCSPAQLYKEPPNPKTWNNCIKSSSVMLPPGGMKKTQLYSKWRGYFNNLLSGKLKYIINGVRVNYAPGKMQLIALEERLNSGSLNLITVQYECDRKTMVNLITTKKPIALADFSSVTYNNTTA